MRHGHDALQQAQPQARRRPTPCRASPWRSRTARFPPFLGAAGRMPVPPRGLPRAGTGPCPAARGGPSRPPRPAPARSRRHAGSGRRARRSRSRPRIPRSHARCSRPGGGARAPGGGACRRRRCGCRTYGRGVRRCRRPHAMPLHSPLPGSLPPGRAPRVPGAGLFAPLGVMFRGVTDSASGFWNPAQRKVAFRSDPGIAAGPWRSLAPCWAARGDRAWTFAGRAFRGRGKSAWRSRSTTCSSNPVTPRCSRPVRTRAPGSPGRSPSRSPWSRPRWIR